LDEARDKVARSIANALGDIASSMDDLRVRIDRAAAAIHTALIVSASELEITALFVRAQEFIDRALLDARRQAAEVLTEAHAEAEWIVAEGHRRTRQLIAEAPLAAFVPAEAVQQLERTIESFSQSNSELTNELAHLHSGLTSGAGGTNPSEPWNETCV
jgi:hypothetical protein